MAMETELPFIFEAVAPGQGLDTLARQRGMEPGSAAPALWMEIYEAEGHSVLCLYRAYHNGILNHDWSS